MAQHRNRASVLTISGSDPSGGAGLQADLKVFHQHGVSGLAIPTLLTAQNSRHFHQVLFLDAGLVEKQWTAIFEERKPSAIKIGALGNRSMVRKIANLLSRPEARGIPVVLDPVMGSTSGSRLLEIPARIDLQNRLFPLCTLITPNAREFSVLTRRRAGNETPGEQLAAYAAGKKFSVLLKGGHFPGAKSTDYLWNGKLFRFEGRRLTGSRHGTGCALASSIAAHLALGFPLPTACRRAKSYVFNALASSLKRGEKELDFWVKI